MCMKKLLLLLLTPCLSLCAKSPEPIMYTDDDLYELFEEAEKQSAPVARIATPQPVQNKQQIVRDLNQQFEKDLIDEKNLMTCIKTGAFGPKELNIKVGGETLLHRAAEKGRGKLIKTIIEYGGNHEPLSSKKETPEQIIHRNMLSVTTYSPEDKTSFKRYSDCLSKYQKATKRIAKQNKKASKKVDITQAIDI